MKRIIIAVWLLFIMAFLCFSAYYVDNEIMINKYEKGEYVQCKLSFLAMTETYIKHYNQGNLYYQDEIYDKAIEEYKAALEKNPPDKKECDIRINIALSMIAPINEDEITAANLDSTIKLLEDAQAVLTEVGCATKDGNGHNEDAQKLYDEIESFKQKLKDQNTDSSDSSDDSEESQDEDEEEKTEEKPQSSIDNAEEKQDQLNELQNDANDERYSTLEEYQYLMDYDFYNGASW